MVTVKTIPFDPQPSGAPAFSSPPTVIASLSRLTLRKLYSKVPPSQFPPLRAIWASCVVKSVSQNSFELKITPGPFTVSVSWIAYGT
jgi:hypothetical protein